MFLLVLLFNAVELLILARCIVSWVPDLQRTVPARIIVSLSEPLLAPFRFARMRGSGVGVDFSPMIALIVLQVIREALHV